MLRLRLAARSMFGMLLLVPMLSLAACGSDAISGPTSAPTIEATTFASALNVNLAASTKTTGGMYYRDLVVGTGAAVLTGQNVSVYYTGWLSNGTQFDARVPTAVPYPFKLGAGAVIQGWDIGVSGMRVGGQRQLIIPPSLGYGSQDYFQIPGNSILVFTVTVVSAS